MRIEREESLFLTVSENHQKREYPEYITLMSEPYRQAEGMIAAYEGVILGGQVHASLKLKPQSINNKDSQKMMRKTDLNGCKM